MNMNCKSCTGGAALPVGAGSRARNLSGGAFFDAHPDLARVKSRDVLVIYVGKGLRENQPELVQGLSR